VIVAAVLAAASARTARAVPAQGVIVQTDTVGMNVYSRDLSTGTTQTVADRAELSEFIGAHYFFADGWRVGANVQLTERLAPAAATGSVLHTIALLPQIGWHFYDPFFAALVFTFAPWTDGAGKLVMGLQGVIGVSIPIADTVKLNVAIEIPYNFYGKNNIGITPLLGVSIKL
jgi:hypothetical protein